ncbi:HCP-like protein [Jaminaea rosea]
MTSTAASNVYDPSRDGSYSNDGGGSSSRYQGGAHPPPRSRQASMGPPQMYSQSNTSAPGFDRQGSSSQGPPLADDFMARSFDQMNLGGPQNVGSSPGMGPVHYRARSPGAASARSSSAAGQAGSAAPGFGSASGSVDRANALYAQQEMYQSAAEVKDENSLAAIADEIDQTAADIRQGGASTPAPPQDPNSWQWAGNGGGGANPNANGGGWEWQQHQQHQHPTAWQQQQAYQQGMWQQQQGQWGGQAGSQDGHYYQQQQQGGGDQGYYEQGAYDAQSNPYYAAAAGYGMDYPGQPQQHGQQTPPSLSRHQSGASHHLGMTPMTPGPGPQPGLFRQGTTMSVGSNHSGGPVSGGRRRSSKDVGLPQQTLPYSKDFVNEYRARMKADPDPEEQFRFARYLIEAAKKIQDPKDGPKQARKYRDALLSESLKLIKRLATTGMGLGKPPYAEAQFFLANCFGNGSLGLQVDHEKAYNLYVQASKQNHPAATYRTAVCNEVGAGTRRDHHRAVLFYRKASALGDTAGMYKLGMILLNGLLGQPRNVREAIVWLKRAAGQADEDNPHALHELGLLHEKQNTVVPHDEAYARELFTQAAQLGYAPSQFKLGSAYEYGALTCPVDPRRSIAWYTKAAGRNDGESELALSGWYLTGSEGVLKQSDAEAYLWARRAAAKGIPKAEYAVGYYSEVGIGVKADLDEAKRWYMRSAAQGNKRAMQRLTELKKMGAKPAKRPARATRGDAEKECVVM